MAPDSYARGRRDYANLPAIDLASPRRSLNSPSRDVRPALMQYDRVYLAGGVPHESDLRVRNLEEEIGLGFGEKLKLCLPCCLPEECVAFPGHSEPEGRRELVHSHISIQQSRIDLNFLRGFGGAVRGMRLSRTCSPMSSMFFDELARITMPRLRAGSNPMKLW